jgi:large subunit ribosomal protein L29
MKMDATQIRNLTTQEIQERLNEAREELMKLRFRLATGELTDHSQMKVTRRTIARLTTILNERMRLQELEGEK